MKNRMTAPNELRRKPETVMRRLNQGYTYFEDQSQARKMEAIGPLTTGIAHDFNNLLMVISSNLHIVRKRLHSPCSGPASDISERIEVIGAAVEKGTDLIRYLMAFSRQPVICKEALNVQKHVKSVFSLLRGSLGESIEVELKLEDNIWPVAANKNLFETALINLAINARDAISGIGKITLEARNITIRTDDEILAENIMPGDYVIITMSDTGCGITPDVMARIFDPFYTTKKAEEGTGLGLYMVWAFVNQSDGYVTVKSEVGKGTVFQIYLPRS